MTDEQQNDDFPAAWRPDQDDDKTIKGTIVGVSLSPDFGFGPYPIVTIKSKDGTERAVHAFHQVLQSELARRAPQRGDEIEITYVGKREPKGNGNAFHVYRVTGGNEPDFNWSSLQPEEERRASVARSADPPIEPAPVPASAPAASDAPWNDEKPPF